MSLDDVVVFSKTVKDHTADLRQILWLINECRVAIMFKKCCFIAKVGHPREHACLTLPIENWQDKDYRQQNIWKPEQQNRSSVLYRIK